MSITGTGLSVGEGGANVVPLSVTENGTYTAEEGTAYSPVNVNVPVRTATVTVQSSEALDEEVTLYAPVVIPINGQKISSHTNFRISGAGGGTVLFNVAMVGSSSSAPVQCYLKNEALMFDTVSGNAIKYTNDVVGIYGDCVVNMSKRTNYKSKLARVIDRTITSITAEDLVGITKIGNHAFFSCGSLTSVSIPESITYIDDSAFQSCYELANVNIPSGITEIRNGVFNGCVKLASITLPSGLTAIYSNAFASCIKLTSVVIPSGVTSIGFRAFALCSGLSSITVNATTPPTLGTDALLNTHADLVIYVPAESVEAYKAATNWSTYASKIQAIPNS